MIVRTVHQAHIDEALALARQAAAQIQLRTEQGYDEERRRPFVYVPAGELLRVAGLVLPAQGLVLRARSAEVTDAGLVRTWHLVHVPSGDADEWTTTTPIRRTVRQDLAVAWARTHSHAAVIRDLLWIGVGDEPDPSEGPARAPRAETQEEREARIERIDEARREARAQRQRPNRATRALNSLAGHLTGTAPAIEYGQAEQERWLEETIPDRAALEDRLRVELERTRDQITLGAAEANGNGTPVTASEAPGPGALPGPAHTDDSGAASSPIPTPAPESSTPSTADAPPAPGPVPPSAAEETSSPAPGASDSPGQGASTTDAIDRPSGEPAPNAADLPIEEVRRRLAEVSTPEQLAALAAIPDEDEADGRHGGAAAIYTGQTLTEALAARGLTHRPTPGDRLGRRDVVRVVDYPPPTRGSRVEVVLGAVSAREVWEWLALTEAVEPEEDEPETPEYRCPRCNETIVESEGEVCGLCVTTEARCAECDLPLAADSTECPDPECPSNERQGTAAEALEALVGDNAVRCVSCEEPLIGEPADEEDGGPLCSTCAGPVRAPSEEQVNVVSNVATALGPLGPIGPADLRGQKRARALERAAQREWSRVVVKRGGGTCASNCGTAFRKGDEAEESGNRRRHVVCPKADPRAQEKPQEVTA